MLEFMLVELVYAIASFLAMTVEAIQLMPLEAGMYLLSVVLCLYKDTFLVDPPLGRELKIGWLVFFS